MLLTGESISYINLGLLREEYSFGVGFLFLHPQINQLKLNFSLAAEVDEWMDKLCFHGSYNWPENHIRSNGVNQGYLFLKWYFGASSLLLIIISAIGCVIYYGILLKEDKVLQSTIMMVFRKAKTTAT